MLEFSGFCEEFHSSVSLFSIDSLQGTFESDRCTDAPCARKLGPRAALWGCLLGSRLKILSFSPNLERLVLRCIDSYDSESRLILQHVSRSTKSAFLCTAHISKFQQKTRHTFADSENFWIIINYSFKIRENLIESVNFRNFDEIFSEFRENVPKSENLLNFWTKLLKFEKIL